MRVSIVQTHIHWQDINANLQHFSKKLKDLKGKTDLAILPEMFSTGFTMNPSPDTATFPGVEVGWMKNHAAEMDFAIAGSVVVFENDKHYNRFLFVTPEGEIHQYDKRHLFTMAGEHEQYEAGSELKTVSYKGWSIALQICYDLRFPCFVRNNKKTPYDLILYVANWPTARISAWSKLLPARAIENQCYVVGVNRIGEDGNNIAYNGHSMIADPYGFTHAFLGDVDSSFTSFLNIEELKRYRRKFPVLEDQD